MKTKLFTLLFLFFSVFANARYETFVNPSGKPSPGSVKTTKNSDGSVSLMPSPNAGYVFSYWRSSVSTDGGYNWTYLGQKTAVPVTVPASYVSDTHDLWKYGFYFTKSSTTYTLTVKSSNTAYGTVSGGGTYAINASVTIKATPKTGYKFTQWNDGNTSASRSVTVTGNKTYTATFEPIKYTVTFLNHNGVSFYTQQIAYGSAATPPTAPTVSGYTFVGWIGNYSNITSATTIYASYSKTTTGDGQTGSLSGVFSISDSTQISFSQGGLQYNAKAGSHKCADGTTQNGVWRFAENQWDAIYAANANAASTYAGWISHFGYGTSGWNSGAKVYMPYAQDTANANYINANLTGTKAYADWGVYNAIFNGGNQPNQWRTLTKDEWQYLLTERENAAQKKGIACIQDSICGLVFLPDSWTPPSGLSFKPGYYEGSETDLKKKFKAMNSYTFAQWLTMQEAGAVFWPIEGSRKSTINPTYGLLHSSTNCSARTAYALSHYIGVSTSVNGSSKYKSQAYAVRLVSKSTKRKYTITWKQDDGTTIEQTTVEYGKTPTHANPTKASTDEYTYTFAGWSPAITTVTGNKTYTATYTATKRKYTITWKQDDGTTIDQTSVEYGATPTHSAPTKPADAEHTYTFVGWSPAITSVTGNQTYTATYTSAQNVYIITWLQDDGTQIDQTAVEYGATPTHSAPAKPATDEYVYTFAGWSPAITSVTGNQTYTATYTSTKQKYIITWLEEDDTQIEQTTVEYGETPTHAAPTKLSTAEYTYTFAGWEPEIVSVTGDATYKAKFNSVKNRYEITWQNIDGAELIKDSVEYGALPDYTGVDPTKPATIEYNYIFDGWTPEVVPVTGDAIYTAHFDSAKVVYDVDVTIPDTIETHGSVIVEGDPTYGDTITLTPVPEDGWYFVEWSDGNTENPREIIVTGDTIIYPIFAQCEEIIVTFSEVITKGETYEFAGMTLMQRGTYMDTTVLANGCDSITVLKLNVVKAKTFNLRVVVNDETMGTVEGAGTFTQGQEVTITAIPASSKYVFVRWYNEDEDINVYDNPYTFTLNRNLQIRAVFRRGKK